MNLVGKIFVFLIFCMSLVFMAFAVMVFATHKNWKDEVMREEAGPGQRIGWKKRHANEQQKNLALQSQKRALEDMIATQDAMNRQKIAKLESELRRATEERDALLADYLVKAGELAVQVTAVKDQQTILENLIARNDSLKKENRKALGVIDEGFAELAALTEENHQAKGELIRLEERKKQLTNELVRAERVLRAHDLSPHTPVSDVPPPIDGFITTVQKYRDDIFVEITVGSDDGIQRGHLMEVYRGDRYLGQIAIVRTTPDRSVGKVDRKKQTGEIREKDRVETRRSLQLIAG